jgi:lactoylglutathione lyase
MIIRLAHVCLHVADIRRTIAFYHDALGFPVQFTFEKNGALMGAYFAIGNGSFIEAFQVAEPRVANNGINHFCLECDDIDAFASACSAKGIACTPKILGSDQAWQSWLQDPDGNRFEVHQYTERSMQQHGGMVEITW